MYSSQPPWSTTAVSSSTGSSLLGRNRTGLTQRVSLRRNVESLTKTNQPRRQNSTTRLSLVPERRCLMAPPLRIARSRGAAGDNREKLPSMPSRGKRHCPTRTKKETSQKHLNAHLLFSLQPEITHSHCLSHTSACQGAKSWGTGGSRRGRLSQQQRTEKHLLPEIGT